MKIATQPRIHFKMMKNAMNEKKCWTLEEHWNSSSCTVNWRIRSFTFGNNSRETKNWNGRNFSFFLSIRALVNSKDVPIEAKYQNKDFSLLQEYYRLEKGFFLALNFGSRDQNLYFQLKIYRSFCFHSFQQYLWKKISK